MAFPVTEGFFPCDGTAIPYRCIRKPIRHAYLRMQSDGVLLITAPLSATDAFLLELLQNHRSFLQQAHKRYLQQQALLLPTHQFCSGERFRILGRTVSLEIRPQAHTFVEWTDNHLVLCCPPDSSADTRQRLLEEFLRQTCRRVFSEALQTAADRLNGLPLPKHPVLKIRRMRSRWGSCIPAKQQITLNTRLLEAPLEAVQAVALHETAHFLHPNHSPQFYQTVLAAMPDYRERVAVLQTTPYSVFFNEIEKKRKKALTSS